MEAVQAPAMIRQNKAALGSFWRAKKHCCSGCPAFMGLPSQAPCLPIYRNTLQHLHTPISPLPSRIALAVSPGLSVAGSGVYGA